ncbi:MAG: DNA-directed RNA polymerase subunit P [Candidatus Nanohaloarchaeota archaeon QJJ-9]|nr:DNA-directed RNA polymerase subunit P [Candidatus Nanohaloarchaeota archaeon QJJ-9]
MGNYVCANCEEEIKMDPVTDRIICPNCSSRIILKKRPEESNTVKAR